MQSQKGDSLQPKRKKSFIQWNELSYLKHTISCYDLFHLSSFSDGNVIQKILRKGLKGSYTKFLIKNTLKK
jgi:hypothetical protein